MQIVTSDILVFLTAALTIWLVVLTFIHNKTMSQFKRLTRGSTNISLERILERVLEKQDINEKKITDIEKIIASTIEGDKLHFQKHSLIRFNPFEDAGGDQSFVIALLDAKNNGLVISSLHSRNGTRVYAKGVIAAKASAHQFTKEEKEAVEKAAKV